MRTRREVLKQFAQGKGCEGILCRACPFRLKGSCVVASSRLERIGAMAILRMFPEKKKPILETGTKIKFSDGSIATISKVDCGNSYSCLLEFDDGHNEYTDYLIDRTWEVVKE